MENRAFADSWWSSERSRRWVELLLAVANLVVSGWIVWTILGAETDAPRRVGQAWTSWITNTYLFEVLVLGVLVLLALLAEPRQSAPSLRLLWSCLGALAGLSVMGAWTIGAALIPSLLLVSAAGSLAALRAGAPFGRLFAWCLAGLGCQVALMISLILILQAASRRA